MRGFQIVILGLFGFFIIAGVIVFALSGRSQQTTGIDRSIPLVIWGTLPSERMDAVIREVNVLQDEKFNVIYRAFSSTIFDTELAEALASGIGPDIVFLSQDSLIHHKEKLFVIPFTALPERTFRDTFVEVGEIYLLKDGALALPVFVDPLVLYWNRSLFNRAGIAQPPRFWDQLFDLTKRLTIIDSSKNVTQSAIALGEIRNISNGKDILSGLIMQAGNSIISYNSLDDVARATLADVYASGEGSADTAIRFFTEFSNPTKPMYSWNRSLPISQDMFTAGRLAMYMGFANELFTIRQKNPNLNFDVTAIPQVRDTKNPVIFADVAAFSITKQSNNKELAFALVSVLAGPELASVWESLMGIPSAHRSSFAISSVDNTYTNVFKDSALTARAFFDPSPTQTEKVFVDMIDRITSGSGSINESLGIANQELQKLLK